MGPFLFGILGAVNVLSALSDIRNVRKQMLGLAAVALLVTGCGPPADLPPLPESNTEKLLPAVRAQLDAARGAVRADPQDAQKNGDYALALHAYDHSTAALVMYERARRLAPKDPRWPYYQSAVLERLGDLEGSLAALDSALAMAPDHVDVMAKRGEALFLLGRLDDAETQLRAVTVINPSYPLAQYYLARIAMENRHWEQAVAMFDDLLNRGLDIREVHQNLGIGLRVLGDNGRAREHLELAARDQTLVLESYDPINMVIAKLNMGDQPHLHKAAVYYRQGNLAAAERELLAALDKNPDSLGAHLHLIRVYAEQSDLEASRRHFDRVMELEPTNATAHSSFGLALSNAGRHADSARVFQRAAELDPGDPQIKIALGGALTRQGHYEEALAEFEASLAIAPENRDAKFLRGNALLALDRYEDAVAALEQATTPEDGKTPLVLRAIANAQWNLGAVDDANAQMEAAAMLARKYGNEQLAAAIRAEQERMQNASAAN